MEVLLFCIGFASLFIAYGILAFLRKKAGKNIYGDKKED